jgi:maltooligosyltrehalose trehalohydrolase
MVSHHDPKLLEAVRRGRRAEFAAFGWEQDMPDPAAISTFEHCFLDRNSLGKEGPQSVLYMFYKELIGLRKTLPAIAQADRGTVTAHAYETQKAIAVCFEMGWDRACLLLNFADEAVELKLELAAGSWRKRLSSAETQWGGPGCTVPDLLDSSGSVALPLHRSAFVVLAANIAPR